VSEPEPLPAAVSTSSAAETEAEPPLALLEAVDARIAVGGACALDELSLRTHGDRVLLAGDAEPLLLALFGARSGTLPVAVDTKRVASDAEVVVGTLRLRGMAPGSGAYHAAVGLAPLDPPLPTRWRVEQYLEWAARLAGAGRREARVLAGAAMQRLGLEAGRGRRLGTLTLAERRAVVLAQAVVSGPSVLVAEAPLSRLEGASGAWLAEVLHKATAGLGTVLSVTKLVPPAVESALVGLSTDVCYFRQGRLLVHRAAADLLAGACWLEICVAGAAAAFGRELATDGIELRGGPACFVAVVRSAPAPAEAPTLTPTSRVLAAAARAKASVLRCVPIL
jgi:ABC-type Na+ transport system ATPase subunit NatA